MVFLPNLTVANLYFDVQQSRGEEKHLILYDVAFNLLLENKSGKPLDVNSLKSEYKMDLNKKSVFKHLMNVVKVDCSLRLTRAGLLTARRAHRT